MIIPCGQVTIIAKTQRDDMCGYSIVEKVTPIETKTLSKVKFSLYARSPEFVANRAYKAACGLARVHSGKYQNGSH